MFSPAFSGGLIEAWPRWSAQPDALARFPPRSAGASLKRHCHTRRYSAGGTFSPAFSGGLIEAHPHMRQWVVSGAFSPAFSGGLIEARTAARE